MNEWVGLGILLFPLLGAAITGLCSLPPKAAHRIAISGIGLSFLLSLYGAYLIFFSSVNSIDFSFYLWRLTDAVHFSIGMLLDPLASIMIVVVNFVSLIVHIYSIAYMRDDPGYQRFFSYISLFTFAMLTLVSADNFLQLFFAWEAVGLVSYLLIGFWFKRPTANAASLKAFLVNRVGDFGFILGLGLIWRYCGSLDFNNVFNSVPVLVHQIISILPGTHWSVITVICLCLFIGAMGKSAQIPLHVWLPESMEGPTPISALIHAATMVTAGIYLITRLAPFFTYSPVALNVILIIGASTALFMGLLALVQTDIKRVIAYSTLSQLGYMMAACGCCAFSAAIFHLITHAFFKALLFLAAGSVILALHHEQDIRKMSRLRGSSLPITYVGFLIGTLALIALPPFSGFYSKDAIIEAVASSHLAASGYAYFCLLAGVVITVCYSLRVFFLVFHSKRTEPASIATESTVIKIALIALSIPAVIVGIILSHAHGFLNPSVFVQPIGYSTADQLSTLRMHAVVWPQVQIFSVPLCLLLAGVFITWCCYIKFPDLLDRLTNRFSTLYRILRANYGFDAFNDRVFVRGGIQLAKLFFKVDALILDEKFVNGSGRLISWFSRIFRTIQSGLLYQYTLVMILGLVLMMLAVVIVQWHLVWPRFLTEPGPVFLSA